MSDERQYMPCCGTMVCKACDLLQATHEVLRHFTTSGDVAAAEKVLEDSPCAFCRSAKGKGQYNNCKNLAVNRSDSEAMTNLGEAYLARDLVPKNELSALGWFVRGAEKGHPMGLLHVADMYHLGTVVETNVNRAKELAVAAAKKGCAKAHELLGVIFLNEFRAASSGAEGAKFLDHWKFAAAGGCRGSMEKMEECELVMPGLVTKEDVDVIREEFEKAAKVEWTEEREECRKDMFKGRIQKKAAAIKKKRQQRPQTR
eukprot:CAMPEP_0181026400 /NCGR_PEP_ID=MMETSP1070-20121207/3621_1 /TAXON_ID=265543 /ORGANISM="Minutocellus polymorphus, Strain NH13" /LENGTH=257 /DNA_ID=CAMNT_0023103593 /DNA_START=96 /DNA_END=869 /DNA_ORIENTATION=-